jgi:TRAP-type C4-dicarboxylate transport system permease small subunit
MVISGFAHKAVDRISGFLAQIAMWGVVAMMLLVVIDVAMRALFNRSTFVAGEMGGYLLVLIAYLGMAEAYRLGRHIRVDIVTVWLPGRLQAWVDAVLCLVGFAALIIVIWRAVIMVHRSQVWNVRIPGVLLTPVYLPQTLIVVGLVALALQCAVDLVDRASDLRNTAKGTSVTAEKEGDQQ